VYVFDRLFETKRVLTAPMGWETVTVRGCSQDGQFCVGTYASIDAFGTFIYGPGIGMEDIRDLIVRLGAIKCASWTLDWALDVAEHGSTLRVVGHGLDGLNQRRGYLASVPIGHYLWTHSRG
ncbi:MAG: hypothetical protein JNM34_08315, partial [Chthonomonadaceae bacterium]|nr:hypothetical protein [Chthonomonadaceae bacterium]